MSKVEIVGLGRTQPFSLNDDELNNLKTFE
jgi:hypothetical protein